MSNSIVCNAAAGVLFFLASCYFFDLVCREQYIDNTPISFEGGLSSKTRYELSFFIFFLSNAISLGLMAASGALLGYIIVQLAIIFISLVNIGRERGAYIIAVDVISVGFTLLLVILRFA